MVLEATEAEAVAARNSETMVGEAERAKRIFSS
jgi:hypothetical protein